MRVATVVCLILRTVSSAASQEGSVVELTEDEVVARAVAFAPKLRGLRAHESAAAAGTDEAEAAAKPRVDVSAGYTRYSDIPEVAFPSPDGSQTVLFPNLPNNYRARIGASFPLYTGGRNPGLLEAARGERSAAAEDLDAARYDLVLEARRAYWRLVTAEAAAEVVEESLAAFEGHLRDARNRERFGLAARNEVLAVEVERDRAELSRLRAETAASVARADLARLLGLESGGALTPTEPLVALPSPADDPSALVEEALKNRSELRALEARVTSLEARARVERSATLPQVSVNAAYLYANPNVRFLPPTDAWNDNWELGVSVGMSLFDGGEAEASEARLRAQADSLRAELDDARGRIRLQVTTAALELRNAEEAIDVASRALEAARESRRVAAERYREGVILSSELLDAETAFLRAELDRTEAVAAQRLAIAALDRALAR